MGPNVIANALPFVGGGLVLTAVGTYGGLYVRANNPGIFFPTFIAAFVLELILFFVAQNVAEKGNNKVALPLLATYSLLSGYTMSGIVAVALGTSGVGIAGIGFAALGCGVTFIGARQIGSNMSESDGLSEIAIIQKLLIKLGLKLTYVGRMGSREKCERVYQFIEPKDERNVVYQRFTSRIFDPTPLP